MRAVNERARMTRGGPRLVIAVAALVGLAAVATRAPSHAAAREGQIYCCFEFSIASLTSYTANYGDPGMPPTWEGRTYPGNNLFGKYIQKRDWSAISIVRFRRRGDSFFLDEGLTRIRASITEESQLKETNADDTDVQDVPCDDDNQPQFHTSHIRPLRRGHGALGISDRRLELSLGDVPDPLATCPNDEGHGFNDFNVTVPAPPKLFIRNAGRGDSWRCAPAARSRSLPPHTDGIAFLKHTWSGRGRYILTMSYFPQSKLDEKRQDLNQIEPGSRAEDKWGARHDPAEC